jgi:hypothetical protein
MELALREKRAAGEHDTLDTLNLPENRLDEAGDLIDLSSQPGARPRRELPHAVEDVSPQPPAPSRSCLAGFLDKLGLDAGPALSFLHASAQLITGASRRQDTKAGSPKFHWLTLTGGQYDLGGGLDQAEQLCGRVAVETLAKVTADADVGPPADVPDLAHEPVPVQRGIPRALVAQNRERLDLQLPVPGQDHIARATAPA